MDFDEQIDHALAGESFRGELLSLRPEMIVAVQEIYDQWEQDEETGIGGICDEIAEAIAGVIASNIEDIEIEEGGHEGDEHAYVVVEKEGKQYIVDLPHHLYEIGGGYSWKKISGVRFQEDDIVIAAAE